MKPLPLLLVLAALASPAAASIDVVGSRRERWSPASPGELVRFDLAVEQKRVLLPGDTVATASWMTDVRVVLETADVPAIERFGVVQFIRGCKWSSSWDGRAVTKTLNVSRDHFGSSVIFRHRGWEVDSDSADPVYTSYGPERFALWRWNADPASLDPQGATFWHDARPARPVVFFTDLPGASARFPGSALPQTAGNSTLEFSVCLFRLADLPASTDPTGANIDRSKALRCHEWRDSWVYDFARQAMTSPAGIDPVCR